MKIVCLQENLEKALILTNRLTSSQAQLPILSNVLLDAQKNSFSISSTDLEISLKTEIPAKMEKEGQLTVPAKILLELVSLLPIDKLEMESQETTLNLRAKNQTSTLVGMPASEFPPLGSKKNDLILVFKTDGLKKIIKNVVFAAAINGGRPVLNGVFLKILESENESLFVATDGYRLSLKKGECQIKTNEDISLIIPSRLIRELGFLLDKENQSEGVSVFIVPAKNQIEFVVGNTILGGRLIEGEFPDYEKIIPQNNSSRAVFDREEFLNGVRATAVFARNNANIIRLAIGKGGLLLSTTVPQVGTNKTLVEASLGGEENEIAFNCRFLIEFLTSIEEKEIIFEMTGPLNPGVFKIESDPSLLHIIMPVRLQE